MTKTKRCSKCWKVKPLSEFCKLSKSPDGHRPDCKACRGKPRATQAEKFWHYVDKRGPDECWLWKRSTATNNGYGRFWINGSHMIASRYAYEQSIGPIPEGMEVCHTCDNPACVNPAHLFLGSHTDNMRDASQKRRLRAPHGESHPSAKFSWKQVRKMRRDFETNPQPIAHIARRHKVHPSTIRSILSRETWKEP